MGLYQKASLVQIPSGYKAADAKLYSVVPNSGDGDFTVSSDADATRVNKDGLIEKTVANQARLNYDPANPQDPHLLLEPTRTNIKTNSEAINNWTQSNISTSTNQTTAPDGTNNADKIIENSGSGSHKVYESVIASSGQVYTWSVFLKADTRSKVRLNIFGAYAEFNVANQTLLAQSGITSYKIEDYGNGWGRFSITETANSSSTLTYVYLLDDAGNISYSGDGTSGLFVWGGQMELGSYPTSYIPTAGSQVTRTEDFCFINSGLQNILNTSEGTLFVDVEVPRVSTGSSFERIALTDQTSGTDRILIDDFGGNWRVLTLSSGGTHVASIRSTQANTRIKIAFAYSSSQIRVSYDGNDATTTSISYTPSTTLESFKFSNKDGGNKWQGKIYQAMYFDTALTNAELKQLTS